MCPVVCSICWENIGKNDELQATSCGHLFHAGCIQSWLCQSETCPQCRTDCCAPHQFFLTFEESPDTTDNWAVNNEAQSGPVAEVNRNVHEKAETDNELHKELLRVEERRKLDKERYRKQIECLEVKVANLEILLQEASAKEKTLSEEFHYKLQDLNTEFHYKFQDLKLAKEELLNNLSKSRNVEDQLRNSVEDARRVEEQLRKSLREYSSRQMDLETEKAELQSKLEGSERNARWLKQSIDELQNGAYGWQSNSSEARAKRKNEDLDEDLESNITEYEQKKLSMQEKLRKLRQEIDEYEEKEAKLQEIKKDMKKSKDKCILI